MKTFPIFGDIVTEADRVNDSDVCLQDFKSFLDGLNDNDEVTLEICSLGGDVFTGIAISNLIKQEQSKGKKFTAHIVSIAASIASVIASACDEIVMDSNALFMAHLPWCMVQGNSVDLAKQIQQLDQCEKALISIYRTKFNMTDEEIHNMLVAETWIDAQSIETYNFKCTVNEVSEPVKIAASIKDGLKRFHNNTILERLNKMEKEIKEETKEEVIEQTSEEQKPVEETEIKSEEMTEDDKKEEVKEVIEEIKEEKEEEKLEEVVKRLTEENENLKKELDSCKQKLEECKPDEDVEKRVSGMQSKMQNKINDLSKEFKDKLELKDKELSEMKNQVSDLINKLETTSKEFSEMKSAYEEKESALATLNASVNTPSKTTNWKDLHGKEFFDWVKQNNIK